MLAAGFSAFAPSTMPEAAAANANLYVSAEKSEYENRFGSGMVIEVVVTDPDISDTDVQEAEPDVTLNGKDLRMVQATDGNWYGYFAERGLSKIADETARAAGLRGGNGLDYGTFCTVASVQNMLNITNADAVLFALPLDNIGGSNGTQAEAACTHVSFGTDGDNRTINNVVREPKIPIPGSNTAGNVIKRGGIGIQTFLQGAANQLLANDLWPFIQLYDFNSGENVNVIYSKAGGAQTVALKFTSSMNKFSKLELDRPSYPQGSHVHATITDQILNYDPTDEDVWIWGTNATNATGLATVYQPFDENGNAAGANNAFKGLANIQSSLIPLKFETTGILEIAYEPQSAGTKVLRITDTGDTVFVTGAGGATAATATTVDAGDVFVQGAAITGILGNNTAPVSFTELLPNVGIFGNYDNGDNSNLRITNGALRGTSATMTYNEVGKTVLVANGFATVDIAATDAEWNSGETFPVTLTDTDQNKNGKSDEDLDFFNPVRSLIPSLSIGDPFTLGEAGNEATTGGTRAQAVFVRNFTASAGANTLVADKGNFVYANNANNPTGVGAAVTVQRFSERALLDVNNTAAFSTTTLIVDLETTSSELFKSIRDPRLADGANFHGFNFLNIDIRGISVTSDVSNLANVDVYLLNSTNAGGVLIPASAGNLQVQAPYGTTTGLQRIADDVSPQRFQLLNSTANVNPNVFTMGATNQLGLLFNFTRVSINTDDKPIAADFFSFGFLNNGLTEADRINNMIIRIEAEETGDNTSVFAGALEYIALNQLNILNAATYEALSTIADDPTFIVHDDLDDEDAPRVNYNDLGADGVTTQVADQQDAPMHSGVVSFDKPTYKKADTVLVTLEDQDLNTDSELIDIYTVVTDDTDSADDTVGSSLLPTIGGQPLGRLLDITFDDARWQEGPASAACDAALAADQRGLASTGFTLIESGISTGIFTGDFQVPAQVCNTAAGALAAPVNSQGLDMEVNYVDYRDASGQTIEVGDGAGIRANTGSVSLDRTVYPVPWGVIDNFAADATSTFPNGRSIFPVHLTGIGDGGIATAETLGEGLLTIHVQVNDPDFDTSGTGEDIIGENVTGDDNGAAAGLGDGFLDRGPVSVTVSRGANSVVLAYAGGNQIKNGVIDVGGNDAEYSNIRQLGPITETAPTSGIFEFDLDIAYTDGPAGLQCPPTTVWNSLKVPGTTSAVETDRFDANDQSGNTNFCILQGDVITVEYTDPADASGKQNTVTDSASFDLRNGALQSDKSVYIIGSDMILTLIEPDFDLDNDLAETYDLDLIEWDSDAATVTMGDLGGDATVQGTRFDPEPFNLRETGDSTGIFQVVIEIPNVLGVPGDNLERGEEIVLEYTDWGPSGSDFVGDEDEDINLTLFTSNFGATVELDQKVYTWTDKVYITIVAPDHNFDSNLIDEIGETSTDAIKVSTRGHDINRYRLVETGTDTGIFTGEVILTGFSHDADGDLTTGDANGNDAGLIADSNDGSGPTDGFLGSDDDDGLTVSFEFSEDETVVGSSLIRWNIGEVAWLEASYPATGTGVLRIIDPDMNLNPEAVDTFQVDAWSDSDAGGIDLTVTETNEATGIFEGTVFFTTTDESSGHRLRVAEGDTITGEYSDNTLPDPYTTADELDIAGTAFIGTVVPPLERAPASNARVVDAFGNTLDTVSVDQQVQITADLTNGQDREQPFAYLVQIQDEDGVTVSLAWITGSLSAGQSFSPALSWIPTAPGTYTATVFVWESVDNPTALSPPVSAEIDVS
jgi:hypothetical protein